MEAGSDGRTGRAARPRRTTRGWGTGSHRNRHFDHASSGGRCEADIPGTECETYRASTATRDGGGRAWGGEARGAALLQFDADHGRQPNLGICGPSLGTDAFEHTLTLFDIRQA